MKKKIVILHGWTYELSKWQNFIGLLAKEGFDVITPKIPGLTQKSDEVWDLDKYTDWLKKYFDGFNSKVILLGHSNGGRLAIAFASRYPEKISKLILIDSAGIYHNELPLRLKRAFFKTITKFGKKFTSSDYARKIIYKVVREKDYEMAPLNMRLSLVNLIQRDLTSELKKIHLPTQIIWGKGDKTTPLSDGFNMKEYIADSKLSVIPQARHSPFYTHPAEVLEIIKNDI